MGKLFSSKSFTLIELLVVIGILAVLTATVILIINPMEYLRQTRDVTRMNDLGQINQALTVLESQGVTYFGTANTVYVSIPDNASSTCGSLGLPTLPPSYSYHCVTASNLQNINGTGWISVDFTQSPALAFSNLPIDPTNTTSTSLYYTYIPGGSWKLFAIVESNKYKPVAQNDGGTVSDAYEKGSNLTLGSTILLSGWIRVPGDSTFGTSDFWVMKYDAKCVQASNNTPLTSPDTGYHTYSNSSQPCTGSSYYIASTSGGYPIVNIDQPTSASYCISIGAHLITNNEWQTITWNVQNIASNWKNGVIGSTEALGGGLYRGNSNSLLAMDGSDPLSGTNTRTLTLSNGSVVWDMAGNVWEWINNTIIGNNEPTTASPGFTYRQFTAITNWGTMTQQTAGPLNSAWNSAQGIGQILSDGTASNNTTYGFLRGGPWNYSTFAGVEALNLMGTPPTVAAIAGFRCAR